LPSSKVSWPANIFSKVLLPVPFLAIKPILSPWLIWNVILEKSLVIPKDLEIDSAVTVHV
jgi:hypothetical protein